MAWRGERRGERKVYKAELKVLLSVSSASGLLHENIETPLLCLSAGLRWLAQVQNLRFLLT